MKDIKTNAMRILDKLDITYQVHHYDSGGKALDGITVAGLISVNVEKVYKTLVTQSPTKNYYVFVIPVAAELDLKSAARAASEKSLSMIPVADLIKVTGYMRGGCSPIGMKKNYPVFIDTTAPALTTMVVSAGKIGWQIELSPDDLASAANAGFGTVIF